MQFFACLVLNGVWIVLQPLNMSAQLIVLALQILHLLSQQLRFLTFMLVGRQPIRAENDVVSNSYSQCRGSNRRSFAPADRKFDESGREPFRSVRTWRYFFHAFKLIGSIFRSQQRTPLHTKKESSLYRFYLEDTCSQDSLCQPHDRTIPCCLIS